MDAYTQILGNLWRIPSQTICTTENVIKSYKIVNEICQHIYEVKGNLETLNEP